jgi:hypothetical protein
MSLFDQRDMAAITSPDYPGERLIVCRNPDLARERTRKREDLLAATEADLAGIAAAVRRARNPLRGEAEIALKVGAVVNRHKVAKHFELSIGAASFSFHRKTEAIAAEAALDGIYVVRTNLPKKLLDDAATVGAYKSLARVEIDQSWRLSRLYCGGWGGRRSASWRQSSPRHWCCAHLRQRRDGGFVGVDEFGMSPAGADKAAAEPAMLHP